MFLLGNPFLSDEAKKHEKVSVKSTVSSFKTVSESYQIKTSIRKLARYSLKWATSL